MTTALVVGGSLDGMQWELFAHRLVTPYENRGGRVIHENWVLRDRDGQWVYEFDGVY